MKKTIKVFIMGWFLVIIWGYIPNNDCFAMSNNSTIIYLEDSGQVLEHDVELITKVIDVNTAACREFSLKRKTEINVLVGGYGTDGLANLVACIVNKTTGEEINLNESETQKSTINEVVTLVHSFVN